MVRAASMAPAPLTGADRPVTQRPSGRPAMVRSASRGRTRVSGSRRSSHASTRTSPPSLTQVSDPGTPDIALPDLRTGAGASPPAPSSAARRPPRAAAQSSRGRRRRAGTSISSSPPPTAAMRHDSGPQPRPLWRRKHALRKSPRVPARAGGRDLRATVGPPRLAADTGRRFATGRASPRMDTP